MYAYRAAACACTDNIIHVVSKPRVHSLLSRLTIGNHSEEFKMEVCSDLGFPGSRSVKKYKTRIGELSLSILSVCLLCLAFHAQPVHRYDNRVRKLGLPSGVHLPTDVGGENVIGEWKFGEYLNRTPSKFPCDKMNELITGCPNLGKQSWCPKSRHCERVLGALDSI